VEAARESKEQGGKVTKEIRSKLDKLSEYVDVVSLARKSLGTRWGNLPKSQRNEFIDTLSDILEEIVYPKAVNISARADDFVYKQEEKSKNFVLITGFIEREKLGEIISNPFTMRLEFDLKTRKIVDAYVEEELISANLKRQFDRALEKRNFAEIINLMKKRVAKARKENSSSSTAGAR